ncbi:MAG TPA: hypothetical protein VMF89_14175, partial [Polyangiales bacterium]|nr:hypothetical protein [Polyangiales bacterium]
MKTPQGSGLWIASGFLAVLVTLRPSESTSQKAPVELAATEESEPQSAEGWQAALSEALDGRGIGSTRFLVATIPDPELGPLAVYTDETLAAISSAAVDAGYLLHAHVLPWTEPGTKDKQGFEISGLLAASNLPDGLQYAAVTSEQHPAAVGFEASIHPSSAQPRAAHVGALIFKRLEPFELLTVLLVGESAVKGVDATELREALTLAGCMKAHGSIAIGVLGPTFSGSAPGMWRVFNETSKTCDLHIITGSATGVLYEETLDKRHHFTRAIVTDEVLRTYLFG